MKFKKYWKIILSLAAVLLLSVIVISNIEITMPEDTIVQGNAAEQENELDEDSSSVIIDEEQENVPLEESKKDEEGKKEKSTDTEVKNKSAKSSEVNKSEGEKESPSTEVARETYTEPQRASNVQAKAEDSKEYYSFSIDCYTVLNNMGDLKKGKEGCLGNNGLIFSGNVEGKEGESVKQLLLDVCKKNNIKVSYKGDYITGINNLMEKDCGKLSGWMYSVNGVFPMKSVGAYKIKKNDVIKFRYTCKNCGKDLT